MGKNNEKINSMTLLYSFKKAILRSKPIYKYLEEKYGGKWKYDRRSFRWFCIDEGDNRYAVYVSNNFYNDGTYPEAPPSLYIYGDKTPIRVF